MPVRRDISDWESPAARNRLMMEVVSLMHPSYAMSHSMSMPQRIIRSCIVPPVKWHELIARLVKDGGGSLPVAKAMRAESFQGTLHKIAAGRVDQPSRASAKRIADHFGIPVDAMYDDAMAARLYAERFRASDRPSQRVAVPEPAAAFSAQRATIGRVAYQLASACSDLESRDRQAVADSVAYMLTNGPSEKECALIDQRSQRVVNLSGFLGHLDRSEIAPTPDHVLAAYEQLDATQRLIVLGAIRQATAEETKWVGEQSNERRFGAQDATAGPAPAYQSPKGGKTSTKASKK